MKRRDQDEGEKLWLTTLPLQKLNIYILKLIHINIHLHIHVLVKIQVYG